MNLCEWVLTIYVGLGCLYWLVQWPLIVRVIRRVPNLSDTPADRPGPWPPVSQIVPACNEADTIEAAVQSRLAEGYPDTEIILVDDRSDDGTGAIVDRLAAADARVRPLHIDQLPDGWLGKVHALHCGTAWARGEWLLFSDADVHLRPTALRRAIHLAEQRGLDHLAVLPELWPTTFLVDALMATFVRIFCLVTRMWAVENGRSRAALGIGAFNLVRRSAFERTRGFEWLRLEVVDDLGVGQMLKDAGARTGVAGGLGLVALHWYRTIGDVARGMEKSALSGPVGFSAARVLFTNVALLGMELAPFVGLLPAGPALPWLGLVGVALALAAQLTVARWARRPLGPALFIPLAAVVGVTLNLRAGILALKRRGLLWRGRVYPLSQLRAGTRVRPL